MSGCWTVRSGATVAYTTRCTYFPKTMLACRSAQFYAFFPGKPSTQGAFSWLRSLPGILRVCLTEMCTMTMTNVRRATRSRDIIINLAPTADPIANNAVNWLSGVRYKQPFTALTPSLSSRSARRGGKGCGPIRIPCRRGSSVEARAWQGVTKHA